MTRRRSNQRRPPAQQNKRGLLHETLEKRELLAADINAGPQLTGIEPSDGVQPRVEAPWNLSALNELDYSPREVLLQFSGDENLDAASLASGIRFIGSGGDGTFDDGNEFEMVPHQLQFADDNLTVLAKFIETFSDDRYRLLIVGHDPVTGARGLQDIGGDSFCEAPGDHEQVIEFDVEFESQETALDRYIAKPDSSYTYTKVAELSGPGYTTHIIDMTSQTWRSPAEVNDPVWNHWVQIVVPTSVQSDTAILTIGGGSNLAPQPTTTDPFALQLALASGQITISLPNIPNQPLFFTDDPGTAYFEDALLAYSYDKFLDGGDEEWPVILPMTKAAVRAMDTAQDFLGGIGQSVQDFVVTGGSKRGWTTWLTAAVDDRVSAIAPLVFDVLNMEVSIENHRENYLGVTENIIGGYARAIQDYTRFEVFDRFGTDPGVQLGSIIDPFQYRDRFTMPKYLLNGTGDQFFTPDSSLFYFDDLPGEKYLRYVPNTDHSLNQDAVMGGLAWINTIEAGTEIPDFSWTFEGQQNNTIRLQAEGSPTEVNLWRATNPDSLDFRLETAAPTYTSTPLTDQGGGQYVGTVPLPASGGTAYFLELKYEINGQELVFTTQAQIVEPLSGSGTATQNAPLLLSASAGGEFLSVDGLDQLDFAPTELTFRFTGSRGLDPATLGGIQVIPAGGDGVFDGDEQPLTPGFLDFGDSDQIVIARFTDPLPDDRYQIVISGQTDPATGAPALSSIDGVPFSTADGASTQRIEFDVELGSQVVAVVPQPITGTGASRVQHREQIHVYFSGDLLDGTAEDPRFYQLYFTADTIEPGDDGAVILPDSVEYQADLNRAVLTFSGDLAGLAPDGSGTFRLRVGSAQARPGTLPEHLDDLPADVPDTFDSASYIGDLFGVDDNSITVRGEIQHVTANPARWPGLDSPGIRDNRRDVQVVGQADTRDGINVFYYNFASLYGEASGDNLESSITPAQRQRAREALDLYAEHLGVQFIETDERGLQIVTGNLRGLVETADTGAGGVLSEYRVNDEDPTRGVLVLDASENWYDGYGLSPDPENRPSWFVEALRGIGSLLGIGDTFEQVPGVASGSNPALYNPALFPEDDLSTPTDFSIEPDFLSTSDIIPGQALHRPEIKDADLYRFTISEPGRLTIETFAERKLETSLLDTDLKLWRQDPATGEYQLVARNDDFYGNDSFLGIAVMPDPGDVRANYIVGITAKGNDTYNPDIAGSGGGGRSQGFYDMRITFQRSEADAITDVDGSAIDGDADGVAGGEFDFWFRAAPTKDTAAAGQPRSLFVNSRDGVDSPASGTLSSPYKTIQYALAQAEASGTGDILRLLPDGGADGRIATTDDNRPYLIASGVAGNDGALIEVPQGVTLMIDAGAILKLQNAKISVGSEAIDEDRSLAALQVLGAPQILDHDGVVIDGTVHLTSLREERRDGVLFGIDVLPGQPTPTSGDWGGIEFRNDFDYSEGRPVWESEGIFLDYVSHADIRYGGGSITPLDPAVTPLQLHQSRPTLIHNQISEAREAAISADPDSFLETNFSAPIFQQASLDRIGTEFTSDYVRVGPHIRGNTLTDNSINGLFVRVRTPATDERQPMTVSGRFDDFDVTHVLSEALVLAGDAGGPVLSEVRPDGPGVSVNPAAGSGTLAPGDSIHYRITFVTTDGFESVASLPTETAVVGPSGTLELTDLPPAPEEFAGRRLYRLKPTAPSDPSIDYELVTMLDRATPNYTDDGTTRGGQLSPAALNERPNVAPVNFSSATGSLTPGDEFDYRITFYTDSGFETLASAATATATVAADGGVSLFTLPRAPEVFAGRNLYRLDPAGHYELIAQLNRIDTIYVDDGTTLGDPLNPNLLGDQTGERLIPSPDARLAIDPGVVVKLDSARIQAQFGADFYAEGTARNPIIFTSRLDDTYGAGGTFDTNNDGDSGTPAAGDWGGLVFRQGSTGSIDHAVIGFGGGESAEAGEFAFYNPIEILQADARVTHTVIRDNADGHDGTFAIRGGLGFNSPAAIFVRGAQPILVDNIIRDSEGAAISINPDALTHHEVADWGRSTGPIDQLPGDPDNQGPLIQRNLIGGNDINGLSVRNESLSTESVWDDTDIVHVVEGQVYAWNHHHRSSLRLESDPGQSLVVKFGPGGALVADRYGTATEDSIGGTLQVIGQPGFPVINTSIRDCSVGAGFTPDGLANVDTENSGGCLAATNPDVMDVVILLDDTSSFELAGATIASIFPQVIAELQAALPDTDLAFGITRYEEYSDATDLDVASEQQAFILNQPVISVDTPEFDAAINSALMRTSPGTGVALEESAIEALSQIATGVGFDGNGDGDTEDSGPAGLVTTQTVPDESGDVPAFSSFVPDPSGPVILSSGSQGGVGWRANADEKIVILATDANYQYEDDGATEYTGVDGVTVPATDFSEYTNFAGEVVQTTLTTPGGTGATIQTTVDRLIADGIKVVGLEDGFGDIARTPLEALARLTGGVNAAGQPLVFDVEPDNASTFASALVAAITGGTANPALPGDWYGLVIDAGANDRNVAFVPEQESQASAAGLDNAIPDNAQELGSLARGEKSADDNRRLGFNIRGALDRDSDIDVYTFEANGGTVVYLDIDDTQFGLDTVVELVDRNGQILALNDNSGRDLGTSFADNFVNNLGDTDAVAYLHTRFDERVEGPNPLDAGMRVVLNGNSATVNQYYVRVRSSNGGILSDLQDPGQLTDGQSSGQYQLSIRLRETDEIAGSTVSLADIRYATNAIDVPAAPLNSPLASEYAEPVDENGLDTNDSGSAFNETTGEGTAQFADADAESFGAAAAALMITDRGVLRTSGVLGNQVIETDPNFDILRELDVDVYQVALGSRFGALDVDTQPPDVVSENRFISTIFDIDYADQVGGPNTSLAVYNALGQLILHGRDSNIADDQGRPTLGTDMQNLAGGSAGTLDAYIGPVEMQEGIYYVVVSSAQMIPATLNQFFEVDSGFTSTRVLPVDSTRRIGADGFEGTVTALANVYSSLVDDPPIDDLDPQTDVSVETQEFKSTAEGPVITPLFDDTSIVPYTLEDMKLFVTIEETFQSSTQDSLISVDPFTGQLERIVGSFNQNTEDLAIRPDGELFFYNLPSETGSPDPDAGNVGNFFNVSSVDASLTNAGDDDLAFQQSNEAFDAMEGDDDALFFVNALTFRPQGAGDGVFPFGENPAPDADLRALAVGDRSTQGRDAEIPLNLTRNIVYSVVETSGAVTNRGSTDTDFDREFTDLAGDDVPYSTSFGPASEKVEIGVLDVSGTVSGIAIDPISGPNLVYAVTDEGRVYTFDANAPLLSQPQPYPGPYTEFIAATDRGVVPKDPNDFSPGPVEFTGMTLGPTYVGQEMVPIHDIHLAGLDGRYSQVLFGVTSSGWLYAVEINPATGQIEPAHVLVDGNYAVPLVFQTGFPLGFETTGVAFSTRQENPWHITLDRDDPFTAIPDPNGDTAVHGTFIPHNQSRIRIPSSQSLYFGFEISANEADNTLEGGVGTLNPGGVHGSTVSRPFSLENYNSGDQPTLYFTYFLDVEDDADFGPDEDEDFDLQRDSFRVFAAGDDGQWRLLGTSDSFRSFSNALSPTLGDEYDYFESNGGIPVQELFDNTDRWRQARVDLSPLAGHQNVQLRFDFATAGGMRDAFALEGDLTEIVAVPGEDLSTGDRFELLDTRASSVGLPTSPVEFEFVRTGDTGSGDPGVVEIEFNDSMSRTDVRDAIRSALATGLGTSGATVDNYTTYGVNRIRTYGKQLVVNNSPLGFSTFLPGDEFGSNFSNLIENTAPAENNDVEGVYIDDIVIGFAERGEMVLNAPSNRDFVVLPETRTAAFNTDPLLDDQQPEFPNETLTGDYTLEIRQGAEYGVPEDYDPQFLDFIRLGLNEQKGWGRSFDTNDRLAEGAVTLIVPHGEQLVDGDSFSLSNGVQSLTFEFDSDDDITTGHIQIPFIGPGLTLDTTTDEEIARRIRDAINSPAGFEVLGIYAGGTDSRDAGVANGNRIELFGEGIQVNPSGGRFLKVDLVEQETFYGREGARTIPVIDHDDQLINERIHYDTFARATVSEYVDGATDTLVAVGKIGDRVGTGPLSNLLADPASELLTEETLFGFPPDLSALELIDDSIQPDADIIKIRLNAGDQIDVDVDSRGWNRYFSNDPANNEISSIFGPLDVPLVEIYSEQNGVIRREADNLNTAAPGEAYQGAFIDDFTADSTGYYYIRVTSNSTDLELPDGRTIGIPAGFGEYQLTVRPSASVTRDVMMADYHFDSGDTNVVRDQGQLIIESNTITRFAGAGIVASFDPGNPQGLTPENPFLFADPLNRRPGAAALLRNPNNERLLPGTVIENNVIVIDAASGIAARGIVVSGDPDDPSQLADDIAPVPFGRIVNNTLVGAGLGIGIEVSDEASPTVLNNIVTGFSIGVQIADDSTTTITGGNAFQSNTEHSNQPLADSSIVVAGGQPLFEDAAGGIYIPAAGSPVIDSSFAALVDRQAFVDTVKQPVGIAPSPIKAPIFDAFGVRRFDDPTVQTPGGIGENVFIDRGALDRSDFAGPIARLTGPRDFILGVNAGLPGGDIDPAESFALVGNEDLPFFEVQLFDPAGSGVDPRTITEESVILTENGRPLTPGVDYTFAYSANNQVIRLTPLSGRWRGDVIYDIFLNNDPRFAYAAQSGAAIADGDQLLVTDQSDQRAVFEFNLDSDATVTGPLSLTVPDGTTAADLEGTFFTVAGGGVSGTFQYTTDLTTVFPPRIPILLAAEDQAEEIAGKTADAIGVAAGTLLNPAAVLNTVLIGEPPITLSTLPISTNVGTTPLIAEGVSGGAIPIEISSDDSATDVAAAVAAAVNSAPLQTSAEADSGTVFFADIQLLRSATGGGTPIRVGGSVPVVSDLTGNMVQPTRANGDIQFTIIMDEVMLDFGDAPSSYDTLLTDDGARHTISTDALPRLGDVVDAELTGQPVGGDDTDGIDDEDGLQIGTLTVGADTFTVFTKADTDSASVTPADVVGILNREDPNGTDLVLKVFGQGFVHAWIDFDRSGDFDIGERVLAGQPIDADVDDGDFITFHVDVPGNAQVGETWMRVRISPAEELGPTGVSIGGEVEDYQVEVISTPPIVEFDDELTTDEDTAITGISTTIKGNDTIPAGTFVSTDIEVIIPPANGTVSFNSTTGEFDYQPNADFNGVDTFTYRVGPLTASPGATVTITVNPVNDDPVFTMDAPLVGGIANLDVLEDDPAGIVIPNFATGIGPGPATATDETATQSVTFTVDTVSAEPGLLTGQATLTPDGTLTLPLASDAVGTATFTVRAEDGVGGVTEKPLVVNVRKVNDPPRANPALAGTSVVNGPDDQYAVNGSDNDGDGLIDPVITYTLKEDNTQSGGTTGTPYFIPLTTATAGQVGLLDVLTVGPSDEQSDGQSLTLLSVAGQPLSAGARMTDRGGTLTPRIDGSGFDYIPPTDYNSQLGAPDSFSYVVGDDGQSYNPSSGALEPDPQTRTNRVLFQLNPVNDRPFLIPATDTVTMREDTNEFLNYVLDFGAGPLATAFDELNPPTDQSLTIEVVPNPPLADVNDLFDILPTIDLDTGTLTVEPADDVFGVYQFDVILRDSGADDSARGDVNQSSVGLTIEIQPVNDPPMLDPLAPALQYTVAEDAMIEIPVNGGGGLTGLLDVFLPGPSGVGDESAAIDPGGNQTLSLRAPLPTGTTAGGTLQYLDSGGPPRLLYTPPANFSGVDSFVYTVIDDGITINSAGVPSDDFLSALGTAAINVTADNDPPQFSGGNSVTVDESSGEVSISQWATSVLPGPPNATDEIEGNGTVEPQTVEFVFTQTAGDPNLLSSGPSAIIDPVTNDATLNFELTPTLNGSATFSAVLRDSLGAETAPHSFTINVNSVNDPPTFSFITNAPVTVAEESGEFSGALLENISPGPADEASQTVSFEVQPLQPPFAELFSTPPSVGPDGTLTFTPAVDAATGITGPVPVRILARDSGDASSGLFGFQIVITEVNDTPFAANDLLSGDEDTVQSIDPQTLISNDLDPDLNTNPSENLTVELVGSTSESGATVSIDPISGAIIYDPTVAAGLQSLAPGETSFDTFAYQLVDAAGAVSNSAVVSIDISGVNDPPRLLPDTPQLQIGGPTVIDALANDTDIDGNLVPSSIEFPQLPSFGSISVSSGGLITYTPFDPGFEGEDSFTYTVADNLGARSESAVVALSTNAGPLAVGDLATTLRGQAVEIDVAGNDVDIDGQIDLGSIEIVTSPLRGTATPQSDGTVVYTPAAGFVGNDSFAYRISDTQGRHSNVATVGISVIASSLQNTVSRWDVNDDGAVTALDALLVLNHLFLRSGGTGVIQVEPDDDPFQGTDENGDPIWRYYDVNGDQRISASDALEIVNRLRELNIESEAEGEPTATVSATMPAPAAATLDSGDPSSDEDPAPLTGKAVRKVSSHSLPPSVSGDVIDLIAADHDQKNDDEREEMTAAIDQTLARLL